MPAGLTIDTDAAAGPVKTSTLKLTPEEEAATKTALKNATKGLSNEVAVLRYAIEVKGNTDPKVAKMLEKRVEKLDKARSGSFFEIGGRTKRRKNKKHSRKHKTQKRK
jgi:hypothetical protein